MKKMVRMVKNVTHYYRDPVTGERKSKYFGDGTFEDIQKQIEDFMREINADAENKTESDTNRETDSNTRESE